MSRKAAAKSSKKKSKAGAAADRAKAVRTAVAVGAVLGLVAIGAGVTVGSGALDERAAELLTPADPVLTIDWPMLNPIDGQAAQTWLPVSERERLTSEGRAAAAGGSPLSSVPLREVSNTLAATGWFAEIPVVKRRGDGSIHVTGRWRVPAAVIRHAGREELVSWSAVRLPISYGIGQSGQRYLMNPAFGPADTSQTSGVAATPWPGDDITAGLALLRLLGQRGLLEQVAGIDLNASAADVRLTIITDRGTRVVWGAGPQQFRAGEQPTEVKVDRLRSLVRTSGRIDGGSSIIEIHGPQILVQRPES